MANLLCQRRRVAVLVVLLLCLGAGKPPAAVTADSLAEVIRRELPQGWTISVENERVTLERAEPVEIYNAIGLPGDGELQDEMIRKGLLREKLKIELSLGDRISTEQFKQIGEGNQRAIHQAQDDHGFGRKWSGDEKFWREHPKYGYRKLPILDAGTSSIYLATKWPCLIRPVSNPPRFRGSTMFAFYDKAVGNECQAIIDDLAKHFEAYP